MAWALILILHFAKSKLFILSVSHNRTHGIDMLILRSREHMCLCLVLGLAENQPKKNLYIRMPVYEKINIKWSQSIIHLFVLFIISRYICSKYHVAYRCINIIWFSARPIFHFCPSQAWIDMWFIQLRHLMSIKDTNDQTCIPHGCHSHCYAFFVVITSSVCCNYKILMIFFLFFTGVAIHSCIGTELF